MSSKSDNVGNDPTILGNERPRRDPDPKDAKDAKDDRMSKSGRLEPGDLSQRKNEPGGERQSGADDTAGRSTGGDAGSNSKPSGNKPRTH